MDLPVHAISPDKLPAESPIQIEEIYQVIGSLYLDSYHRMKSLEQQAKSVIQQYAEDNNRLKQENDVLKQALNGKNTT